MADHRIFGAPLNGPAPTPATSASTIAGPFALAAALLAVIAHALPHAALLPSVSLAAIATAMPTALVALRHRGRHDGTITLMDVAGALALIGCAAAMLSNPESIAQTFAVSLTR